MAKYHLLITKETTSKDNIVIANDHAECNHSPEASCFNKPDYKCSSLGCTCPSRNGVVGRYYRILTSTPEVFRTVCEGNCILLMKEDDNNA